MTQATASVDTQVAAPTPRNWWRTGGLVLGWVGFLLIWGLTSRFLLNEFVLPGPITDRETVAGWRQWRLTRHSFVPAPG